MLIELNKLRLSEFVLELDCFELKTEFELASFTLQLEVKKAQIQAVLNLLEKK